MTIQGLDQTFCDFIGKKCIEQKNAPFKFVEKFEIGLFAFHLSP